MIKRLSLLIGILAVGLQSALGFSLLGPLPGTYLPITWTGPGGEPATHGPHGPDDVMPDPEGSGGGSPVSNVWIGVNVC